MQKVFTNWKSNYHEHLLIMWFLIGLLAIVRCADGNFDGPAYSIVFLGILVISAFARPIARAGAVGSLMVFTGATFLFTENERYNLTSVLWQTGLTVAFAVIGALCINVEIVASRKAIKKRVEFELARLRATARSYRLLEPLQSETENRSAVKKPDERLTHAAVEEIHQAVFFSLELVRGSLRLQTALLLWLNETATHLRVAECSTDATNVSDGPFLAGDGIFGAALAQAEPVSLAAVRPDTRLPYYEGQVQPAGSVCVVPVFDDKKVCGLLVVDRKKPEPFTSEEESLLLATTRHTTRAIQNERLFVQLERAKVEQGKLYRAAQALGAARNEAEVLEAAVQSAREVAAFDFAAITLFNPQERVHEIRAVSGEEPTHLLGAHFKDNGGLVAMVVQNRFALPYRGELERTRQVVFSEKLTAPPTTTSVLVLPLIVREQVLGTLVLGAKRRAAFSGAVRPTLEVLARHVAVSLANARMVTKLEEMATTDGMTGLLNKRALLDAASDKLAAATRFGRKLSIIVADIDFFKGVNDSYGHDAGDIIIKGLGEILKRAKRATDSVARFGGEEFVVLCEETDTTGALLLAERIREELARTMFHMPQGALQVTCSLGVATFPEAGHDWDSLFKSADDALYVSKQAGRNRVTAWALRQRKFNAA